MALVRLPIRAAIVFKHVGLVVIGGIIVLLAALFPRLGSGLFGATSSSEDVAYADAPAGCFSSCTSCGQICQRSGDCDYVCYDACGTSCTTDCGGVSCACQGTGCCSNGECQGNCTSDPGCD